MHIKHTNMAFYLKLIQFLLIIRFIVINIIIPATATNLSKENLTKNCVEDHFHCGDFKVPYPFGATELCSLGPKFIIRCDKSSEPYKAYLSRSTVVVHNITLDGEMEVFQQYVARECYDESGVRTQNDESSVWFRYFTISETRNKLVAVGCDANATLEGFRGGDRLTASCKSSSCGKRNSVCEASIPRGLQNATVSLSSSASSRASSCSYAFVVEESEMEGLLREGFEENSNEMPLMVLDWSIGDFGCDVATRLENYSCLASKSKCVDSKTGVGYICQCLPGFEGNPYFPDGCLVAVSQNITISQGETKTHTGKTKRNIEIGAAVSVAFLVTLILAFLWRKAYRKRMTSRETELRKMELQTGFFTFAQIKTATNNFDLENKIGEGGFGPVYKGKLPDGTLIAVKLLSTKSKQGNREFVTEIGVISALRHPNLVRLYGCCIERNKLLLVYEYMENNSVARSLFGPEETQLNLDWPMRKKICLGVAKGLAFLHEESVLKIVHRDIKTTNILLDKDLNAKISDFGLAKLDEDENTHISTRVTGTIGYMAPEYAQWGYLTYKADVYSFGVVALEIIAGKSNMKYQTNQNYICLVDRALRLQQGGNLMELVDPKLGSDFDEEDVIRMIKISLLCINHSAALRPSMSEVVSMIEEEGRYNELIGAQTDHGQKLPNLKIQRNPDEESQSLIRSLDDHSCTTTSDSASFTDLYPTGSMKSL